MMTECFTGFEEQQSQISAILKHLCIKLNACNCKIESMAALVCMSYVHLMLKYTTLKTNHLLDISRSCSMQSNEINMLINALTQPH